LQFLTAEEIVEKLREGFIGVWHKDKKLEV
jgi:hypothetical protein